MGTAMLTKIAQVMLPSYFGLDEQKGEKCDG
jgi:hypothetical protein